MTALRYGVNAWLFLNEDEPAGTNYDSPNSSYQSLVDNRVYESVNFLGIAFFEVTAATGDTSTIRIGSASHTGNLTNQDYLNAVRRDARKVNPQIKLLATMVYSGSGTLAAVFQNGGDPGAQAAAFAENLVAYLTENGMNGLDVDWEPPLSTQMTRAQFKILFSAVRQAFDAQPVKLYLSMAPAWPSDTIDYETLNGAFDIISPQFYDGMSLSSFLEAGMAPGKIGYGAQFEPGNAAPNPSAQQVWNQVSSGFKWQSTQYAYQDIFMWRLNSNNFQFEQAQLMILSQLTQPPGSSFDDAPIIAAAGNPTITQLTVRSGDVLDAIQTVSTGTSEYNNGTQGPNSGLFTLPPHGGEGGAPRTVTIPLDDPIVSISGYTGSWFGWQCVLQLTLVGKSGASYGPFGSMANSSRRTPFTQAAPDGQSVVGFRGATVTVPLASGQHTAIVAELSAVFA